MGPESEPHSTRSGQGTAWKEDEVPARLYHMKPPCSGSMWPQCPRLGVSAERGLTHGGSAELAPPQREPRAGRAAGLEVVGSTEKCSSREGLGTPLSQGWSRSSGKDELSGKPQTKWKCPGDGQAFSSQLFNMRIWNKKADRIPDAQIRPAYFLLYEHTEDYQMSCCCFSIKQKSMCDSTFLKAS